MSKCGWGCKGVKGVQVWVGMLRYGGCLIESKDVKVSLEGG